MGEVKVDQGRRLASTNAQGGKGTPRANGDASLRLRLQCECAMRGSISIWPPRALRHQGKTTRAESSEGVKRHFLLLYQISQLNSVHEQRAATWTWLLAIARLTRSASNGIMVDPMQVSACVDTLKRQTVVFDTSHGCARGVFRASVDQAISLDHGSNQYVRCSCSVLADAEDFANPCATSLPAFLVVYSSIPINKDAVAAGRLLQIPAPTRTNSAAALLLLVLGATWASTRARTEKNPLQFSLC